ncbi:flagellar biosynthetic protein FliR [Alienimonas californiensis]|uniref:Flagellar biosynthesis protein FliR n=1 Tax=Alienimonas californiensis TaxID=2527989 RepID=A0A517PE21_9PLAN|nr:flagellar biosynthetic protein FliR [Alienimonas californiensis]QDT17625.1 flagellar biosynthesis protein FliR [Alienimonas californiensis]
MPFDLPSPDFTHPLIAWGTARFVGFLLVFFRVAGLMTVGPVFGTPVVPANVRVLLAVAAAAVVAPALPGGSAEAFQALDTNGDAVLVAEELPGAVLDSLEARGLTVTAAGLNLAEFTAPAPLPKTPAGLLRLSLGEFSIGFALGLGMTAVLAGLRLAGELVDQQIGTAMGEVFNPMLGASASPTGQLLGLLGTAALLTLPGVDGHLRLFATLLDTFRTLPPGAGWVSGEAWRTLAELAGAGMSLGLRVAAPTMAVMSLMSLTVGFLGRTVPQINVLSVGFPTRAAAGLLILALTLSPATDVLADLLAGSLTALHEALVGLPDPRA